MEKPRTQMQTPTRMDMVVITYDYHMTTKNEIINSMKLAHMYLKIFFKP